MADEIVVVCDGPPSPLRARWTLSINGAVYHARHLRQWHIDEYRWRFSRAKSDGGGQSALRWLLRCALPWRASYALRGDPVRAILAGSIAVQSRALALVIAHVEASPGHPMDRIMEALSDG